MRTWKEDLALKIDEAALFLAKSRLFSSYQSQSGATKMTDWSYEANVPNFLKSLDQIF